MKLDLVGKNDPFDSSDINAMPEIEFPGYLYFFDKYIKSLY